MYEAANPLAAARAASPAAAASSRKLGATPTHPAGAVY